MNYNLLIMKRKLLHPYGHFILPILLFLITIEIVWNWRKDKKAYDAKDTFANLSILAGYHFSKYLFAGYQLFILGLASQLTLFSIPNNVWSFLLCFFMADFVYYWFHRASHHWKLLWAFHMIHHSGPKMNLSVSYRLNWFSTLVSPLFFLPLAIIGFSPAFIAVSYILNILYQFFLHTEAVDKIGRLEGIIDSPSAHRVHHGCNPEYIDKNFGGVLMIWDRVFRTYQPETEKPRYGITTGFISNNPLTLVFKGFGDLLRNKMNYKG